MDPPIPIRFAAISDYAPLCALWEELDEHHRRVRPDLFRKPDGPRRELAWVRDLIEAPDSAILVAELEPTSLSGLAVVRFEQPEDLPARVTCPFVQIHNLVVAAAARRRGVGTALMHACLAWAAGRGVDRVELKMLEFNRGARRFYEAVGFVTARRWMSLELDRIDRAALARLGAEENPC